MSYDTAVLALSGLVGYWPLGETSGTTMDNAEGNAAKDGVISGGYALNQASIIDNAAAGSVDVDGSGLITIPDHNDWSVATTGGLTVGGWDLGDAGTWDGILASKGSGAGYEWGLFRSNPGAYYSILWQAGGGLCELANDIRVLDPGVRHFACMTVSDASTRLRLFVDGEQIDEQTSWTGSRGGNSTAALVLGGRADATGYYRGRLQGMFVVNREMTPTEIGDLYDTAFATGGAEGKRGIGMGFF